MIHRHTAGALVQFRAIILVDHVAGGTVSAGIGAIKVINRIGGSEAEAKGGLAGEIQLALRGSGFPAAAIAIAVAPAVVKAAVVEIGEIDGNLAGIATVAYVGVLTVLPHQTRWNRHSPGHLQPRG